AEQAHEELLRVLGYSTGEFRIRRDGPVRWFSTAGIEQSALAVVTARPVEVVPKKKEWPHQSAGR
ncbi:MAG: hypothetical protein IN803_03275, partial [Cutibacterium sp.]|nr:hypothetical protein [Cutibacterium sp.]